MAIEAHIILKNFMLHHEWFRPVKILIGNPWGYSVHKAPQPCISQQYEYNETFQGRKLVEKAKAHILV